MVTKVPSSAPNVVPPPLRQAANNPPYPTETTMPSLVSLEERRSFEQVDASGPSAPNGAGTRSRTSSVSSHGTWNTDASEEEEDAERPKHTAAATSTQSIPPAQDLPASLRPGVPRKPVGSSQTPAAPPQQSHMLPQQQPSSFHSHNPYLNMKPGSSPSYNGPGPAVQPVELPTIRTPAEELAGLHLGPGPNGHIAPPSAPPPPVPTGAPPLADNMTGKSANSQISQSSNPWQQDLDREMQKTQAQKVDSSENPAQSSGDSYGTPSTPAPSKDKEPATDGHAPNLPPLDIPQIPSDGPMRPQVETPGTKAKRQRKEFYHIKHVNWLDASTGKNGGSLRRSPILTQNTNGPCPILALVNALSLSTPEGEETSFIHTLKTREQITLGLLLDAVFEELVRRNETTGTELPDIGDLYSFLITLHTGMNVNPAFTTSSAAMPGGFEQTKEMQLYGAFHIPLIHGWTSPFGSFTYHAFERSAKTFDEALNVQFLEEEFNAKLAAGGLDKEEQQVYEDLTAVKEFLTSYPTQLSDHGLDTITKWMQSGQIAILFRNDHFCTVYKEPKKGTIMALVTDAGYATHDEVVWESLLDVNGALTEFFSGDFRPVGAPASASRQGSSNSTSGWQTARDRRGQSSTADQTSGALSSQSQGPSTSQLEQEDLDLALALQLQEEEEEASRREEARRQDAHNESLSRQYLDGQSLDSEQRPPIPPRRSHRSTSNSQSPSHFNSSSRTDDGNVPPPTYEQAASDMPYREAGSTPRPPRQGNALGALSALGAQRQQSAFAAQQGRPMLAPNYRRSSRFSPPANGQGYPPGYGNANGGGNGNGNGQGRYGTTGEERCVVM